jgi:hypothetical protein
LELEQSIDGGEEEVDRAGREGETREQRKALEWDAVESAGNRTGMEQYI